MSVAVVTIVSGRHTHLRRQREWLAAQSDAPLSHVVVSMGDPGIAKVLSLRPGLPTDLVALDRAGICVGLQEWPESERWPQLLDRALALGGERWRAWRHGDGAQRAARAMEGMLRRDAS